MTKIRIFIILLTILIVGTIGYLATLYARGYRFDKNTFKFVPNGILVLKSDPSGAQIFINGEIKSATDASISLSPGNYDVSLKKEGYLAWSKRLTIDKEVVTQADISLFRVAPSLSPITLNGCLLPKISSDYAKIACVIPISSENRDKAGLWVIETLNLPFGFVREPRRITDGDLSEASWDFSPTGREILLTTKSGSFILDTASFTSQAQRVNIGAKKDATIAAWKKESQTKLSGQVRNLPPELSDILLRKASGVVFSFDETKILYTASSSATLREKLISQLPGSSTQKEERNLEIGKTYVYDIKEDRNFLVDEQDVTLNDFGLDPKDQKPALRWFPTSKNLILAEDGKVTVMDYDGTNREVVYSGSYIAPYAFPSSSPGKILILTNLGADSIVPNLYSLILK